MNQIINSLLDSDLYKFTMCQAVLELFPNTYVEYRFKNRGDQRFNKAFLAELKRQIELMSTISLSDKEYSWIKTNITFFTPAYLEYLKNYKFNPDEIEASLDTENNLVLNIKGSWRSTILWEVPLMALISELYFKMIDTEWNHNDIEVQVLAGDKYRTMLKEECVYADFGTRRRRAAWVQDNVVGVMSKLQETQDKPCFVGTSNMFYAMKYNLKPIGSVAHEFVQGMQALESINHCNYYAMQNWVKVYNTSLGIYLTDTITTDMFLNNFNRRFAMLYDGLRHDSGCPFEFTDKIIKCYKKLNIDPMSKSIIFSDGLNIDRAIEIKKYCEGKIKCSFGIGTFLTNSFEGSPALNMVIKLWSVNGFPVVKLSDIEGKENGEPKAIENMKWIVKNQLGK